VASKWSVCPESEEVSMSSLVFLVHRPRGQWPGRDALSFALKFIAIKRSSDTGTLDSFMHVYDVTQTDHTHDHRVTSPHDVTRLPQFHRPLPGWRHYTPAPEVCGLWKLRSAVILQFYQTIRECISCWKIGCLSDAHCLPRYVYLKRQKP